ncbi:hypothetical protein TNCV_1587581 [Trichonephila clavipes]|uniref:Uncharacterized protein n=1 Tax=Trichonephila clavipes TaxID=2585209 RepID=A0A8X6RGA4_TRICX|nr:hypothetical protein TNCV_1587581 [Trichonephila clavipes]
MVEFSGSSFVPSDIGRVIGEEMISPTVGSQRSTIYEVAQIRCTEPATYGSVANTPPPVSRGIGERTIYLLWRECGLFLLRQVDGATIDQEVACSSHVRVTNEVAHIRRTEPATYASVAK